MLYDRYSIYFSASKFLTRSKAYTCARVLVGASVVYFMSVNFKCLHSS